MATTSDWRADEEEWELCNDDGFVYNRKKRRITSDLPLPPPEQPPPDPELEERNRRKRKKEALTKLKDQYQKEIDHWEYMSNTLRAMEERSQQQQQQQQQQLQRREQEQHEEEQAMSPSGSSLVKKTKSVYGTVVDELILKVEAQEAVIHDVSNLCDVAEAMCIAQQERFNESFIDLPIWGDSPRELMASLCDE